VNWFTNLFKIDVEVTKVTKAITNKFHEFPCSSDNCLVRAGCTKACDKVELDDKKLMALFMKYEVCPDCGSDKWYEGPSGGMSQNVKCGGCGHYFNWALPVTIERIHISSDGIFRP